MPLTSTDAPVSRSQWLSAWFLGPSTEHVVLTAGAMAMVVALFHPRTPVTVGACLLVGAALGLLLCGFRLSTLHRLLGLK